jgi:hypothetical protein
MQQVFENPSLLVKPRPVYYIRKLILLWGCSYLNTGTTSGTIIVTEMTLCIGGFHMYVATYPLMLGCIQHAHVLYTRK